MGIGKAQRTQMKTHTLVTKMRIETYVASDINTYEVSLEASGDIGQAISENMALGSNPKVAVHTTPDTKVNKTSRNRLHRSFSGGKLVNKFWSQGSSTLRQGKSLRGK